MVIKGEEIHWNGDLIDGVEIKSASPYQEQVVYWGF